MNIKVADVVLEYANTTFSRGGNNKVTFLNAIRSNLGRVHISTRQFVEHFIQSNTIVRFCHFPKIL